VTKTESIRYDHYLAVAMDVAAAAGELLVKHWLDEHTVYSKGYRDIVTEADMAAETLILSRLRTAFPDHAITSEEAGADKTEAPVRWLVDPLDGTTNFSRHNPNFSTTLAAVEEGLAVVGVVYDPLRKHMLVAQRGGGAAFNGKPVHTSRLMDMERVIAGINWPRDPTLREDMWHITGKLLPHIRTLRTTGSAAVMMAYVGTGWLDLHIALSVKPWDQAAAGLIVQESGGVVETVSGTPWTPFSPDPLMAASPAIIEAFRTLLQGDSI